MHFDLALVLALVTLVAAVMLIRTDRVWALVVLCAAGLQTALALGVVHLAIAKIRLDVVLPAVLAVSGGICWSKVATKPAVTAATAVTLLGALELVIALRVLH